MQAVANDGLVDLTALGRLIRGHRHLMGFESGEALCDKMANELDVHITSRSLYEYERGGRTPTYPTMVGLELMLEITPEELAQTIEDDVHRRRFMRLHHLL